MRRVKLYGMQGNVSPMAQIRLIKVLAKNIPLTFLEIGTLNLLENKHVDLPFESLVFFSIDAIRTDDGRDAYVPNAKIQIVSPSLKVAYFGEYLGETAAKTVLLIGHSLFSRGQAPIRKTHF